MPASQTVDYTHNGYLELSIEPVDEPESVYFTEDEPMFEFVMRNKTDREIVPLNDRPILRWVLELGPELGKQLASGDIRGKIPPGDERRVSIAPGLLAYEGNAVLGVTGVSLSGDHESGDGPIQMGVGPSETVAKALYTFTIWDKSHYEYVHERSQRLQRWVVRFAGLTAILATFQAGLLISQIVYGV